MSLLHSSSISVRWREKAFRLVGLWAGAQGELHLLGHRAAEARLAVPSPGSLCDCYGNT